VLLGLVLALAGCGRAAAQLPKNANEASDREHFLQHEGRERRYLVHAPAGWDGKSPLPVVLAFHGGGGRAELQRTQSGLNATSDRHKFIVVYPDGTGRSVKRLLRREEVDVLTWNAGRCCGSAVKENVDDVGFIRALLDALPKQYAVDTNRIYATGMSNGAMMAHRVGVELADRIAAIAPVAGAIMIDGPEPVRPVPILYFHGLKDPSAKYEGGPGRLDKTVHRSVAETIAWWVRANHCESQSVETRKETDCIVERYEPAGAGGAPVVLVKLPEGGHTWPGGVDVTKHLGTGPLIATVSANEMMWEFFSKHPLHDGKPPASRPGKP
jgi:polyhydroxybutyrate depolymerase